MRGSRRPRGGPWLRRRAGRRLAPGRLLEARAERRDAAGGLCRCPRLSSGRVSRRHFAARAGPAGRSAASLRACEPRALRSGRGRCGGAAGAGERGPAAGSALSLGPGLAPRPRLLPPGRAGAPASTRVRPSAAGAVGLTAPADGGFCGPVGRSLALHGTERLGRKWGPGRGRRAPSQHGYFLLTSEWVRTRRGARGGREPRTRAAFRSRVPNPRSRPDSRAL